MCVSCGLPAQAHLTYEVSLGSLRLFRNHHVIQCHTSRIDPDNFIKSPSALPRVARIARGGVIFHDDLNGVDYSDMGKISPIGHLLYIVADE
jgi:hypothetical protein